MVVNRRYKSDESANNTKYPMPGMGEVTKEPLKFGSPQEAMDFIINKLGNLTEIKQAFEFILNIALIDESRSKSEKIKAYVFIFKHLNMVKISEDEKQEIEEKIIFKLVELDAVKELEAMFQEFVKEKNVNGFKYLGLHASEKLAKKAVKELRKLNALNALITLAIHANEEVAKAARKELEAMLQEIIKEKNVDEDALKCLANYPPLLANLVLWARKEVTEATNKKLEAMFQKFVKEKNVDALILMGLYAFEELAIKAVKELGKLNALDALTFLALRASEKVAIEAVKELGELKEVYILKALGLNASDEVAKCVVEELVKLKAVAVLEYLVNNASYVVSKAAEEGLRIVEEKEKNKNNLIE